MLSFKRKPAASPLPTVHTAFFLYNSVKIVVQETVAESFASLSLTRPGQANQPGNETRMVLPAGAGTPTSPRMRAQRQSHRLSHSTQHREPSFFTQSGAASTGGKLFSHLSHIPGIRGRNKCFSCFTYKENTRVNKTVCPWLTLISVLSAWL